MDIQEKKVPQHQGSKRELIREWGIQLKGAWSEEEIDRIFNIFQKLQSLGGAQSVSAIFDNQSTTIQHSTRPGKAGRTQGSTIFLDQDWTDWTLAHELGHRWNNAWRRTPEKQLRKQIRAGQWEWIKQPLRQFEKWLEHLLRKLGVKGRLDWQLLWYNPGEAPPPCGVDRNFNPSEDLAECFAASLFPADAKRRAARAAGRLGKRSTHWDWGGIFEDFQETPRGKMLSDYVQRFSSTQEDTETAH